MMGKADELNNIVTQLEDNYWAIRAQQAEISGYISEAKSVGEIWITPNGVKVMSTTGAVIEVYKPEEIFILKGSKQYTIDDVLKKL